MDRHDITHAVLLIAYLFVYVHDSSARPAVANSVVAIATGGNALLVCSAEFEKCHGAGDEGVGGMHPKGLHRPVLCSSQGAQTQISRQ